MKLPLFPDGLLLCLGKPKDSIEKSLEIIYKYSKEMGYKTIYKTSNISIHEQYMDRQGNMG